jgi:zinc protease
LAFDRFTAALYSDHPYRLPVLGTRKSTAGLRRSQLRSYYRRYFTPDRMVLAVVGDVDGEQVVERIRELFGHGLRPKQRPKPPRMPLDRPPSEPRITFKHRERSQAHVVLGFMGTRLAGADRHAIEVLMAALAGQGGRLFVDLRDRRSLAYAITGFSLEGIEPGFVAFYLGTDPGRVDEALAALREQLDAVRREPLSAAELERAQRHLIGTHAISLQRTSARAAALAFNELYGLGHLAHTRYAERIQAVTRQDVQRVARKYLEPGAVTLSLVGPEQQLPAPAELWQP